MPSDIDSGASRSTDSSDTLFDLIIIGAGMVGATLACLLAQQGRRVAVVETYLPTPFNKENPSELRVSAISRASQKAFMKIGAWEPMLAKRVSPYDVMHVWDGTGDGEIHFEAAELGEPNLGHIIENKVVQLALLEVMQDDANIELFYPGSLSSYTVDEQQVQITLEDDSVLSAELLVGADGANSLVRSLAGIALHRDDYAQQGLVATVQTELPHQNTAWQRFLPGGPLALLPLSDGTCSIVWTLPADKADYQLALEEKDFNEALGEAFGFHLGEMRLVSKRAAFPLMGRHAEKYVLPRIALVGDAAHTIHPLAGQGVNLGIKDVVELAEVIANTSRSAGSYSVLRRYERARKGDNWITQKTMEGFNVLFGHDLSLVKTTRNLGLSIVNKLPWVKNEIIRKAMGV